MILNGRYSKNNTHTFFSKDTKEIKIGRDKSCNIVLNFDKTYSKVQCYLEYDTDILQWKLIVGSSKGPSRNGTWVYALKSVEISDGAQIRINQNRILCKIKEFESSESLNN